MMKVYLAGPEVFFLNSTEIISCKQEMTRRFGFEPNIWQGEETGPGDKFAFGVHIARANEEMMRDSDLIIANLTPFRGISADIGTSYELGFMCAMEKPAFGYSNVGNNYGVRAEFDYYGGEVDDMPDGLRRARRDGQMVEDHGMADNLMIDGGIFMRGGMLARPKPGVVLPFEDLSMFEAVLAAARAFFDKRG